MEFYLTHIYLSNDKVQHITLEVCYTDEYEEELENGETREVLKLHPYLAPYKVAILPLNKKDY